MLLAVQEVSIVQEATNLYAKQLYLKNNYYNIVEKWIMVVINSK